MRTSIYAKIFSIAIGLILLMVVVAIASSFLVNRVGDQLRMQSEVLIPISNVVAAIEAKVLEQEVQLEHLFRLHATPETAHAEVEDTKARLVALSAEIGEQFEGAYALLNAHEPAWFADDARTESARIGALLQGIEREYGDYFSQSQTVIELMDSGRPEEIALADRLVAREEADVYEALDTLRTEVKQYVERGLDSSARHEVWLGILILILHRRRHPARAARGSDRHAWLGRADQTADHRRPGGALGRSRLRSQHHLA